jgi:hypothetical protein
MLILSKIFYERCERHLCTTRCHELPVSHSRPFVLVLVDWGKVSVVGLFISMWDQLEWC